MKPDQHTSRCRSNTHTNAAQALQLKCVTHSSEDSLSPCPYPAAPSGKSMRCVQPLMLRMLMRVSKPQPPHTAASCGLRLTCGESERRSVCCAHPMLLMLVQAPNAPHSHTSSSA